MNSVISIVCSRCMIQKSREPMCSIATICQHAALQHAVKDYHSAPCFTVSMQRLQILCHLLDYAETVMSRRTCHALCKWTVNWLSSQKSHDTCHALCTWMVNWLNSASGHLYACANKLHNVMVPAALQNSNLLADQGFSLLLEHQ